MTKKIVITSFIVVLFDQIIKVIVENNLLSRIEIIKDFFYLSKVYNEGAAFSMFSGNVIFLIVINILILFMLLYFLKGFKKNTRNMLAFGLVIGGLIGNLIDRVVYGHVIDYLKFVIGGYNAPVFNLADMAVVIGVALLAVAIIKKEDVYENNSK